MNGRRRPSRRCVEGGAITALVAGDRKLDDVRRIVGLKSEKRRRRVCEACVEGRVESSSQRDLARV